MAVTPINVLLLAEDPLVGGITSYVLSIVEAFRGDARFRFFIGAFPAWQGEPSLVARGAESGIDVHLFPMSGTFDIRVLGRLRRYCDENQIHVVHTQGYRSTLIAAFARLERPIINTCHGKLVAPTRRLERWERMNLWAMRKHRKTIAVSEFVRQWLIGHQFERERVVTVHNACRAPKTAQQDVRSALGLRDDRYLILYAGRLVAGKGLFELFDATTDMANTTLLLLGDGPLKKELNERAERNRIDARFIGPVDDVAPYFDVADVVALPSELEAMPMALVEAAAHGRAVVATRTGGIPEIVDDGVTGILTSVGDVPALRDALVALRDRDRRDVMGAAAREKWRSEFTLDALARNIAPIYLSMV